MPRASALAVALALAAPLAGVADELRLDVDVPRTAAVAGGALALWGASELAKPVLAPASCRWCEPPGLDRSARDALRWGDPSTARLLSNVAAVGIPGSLAVADLALAGGDLRRGAEDALVVLEAVALAQVAAQAVKYAVGRRRPAAWAAGVRGEADDDLSFPSAHSSGTFAAAAAFGTVARLRGYRGWPAIYAAGLVGAALVGYLRIAADEHWLTDVAAGAVLGTAAGLAVPWLLHRGSDGRAPPAPVAPTPFPLGVTGTF